MVLVAQAKISAKGKLRETDALESIEMGARRLDFIGMKFELSDEIQSSTLTHTTPCRWRKAPRMTSADFVEYQFALGGFTRWICARRELFEKSWLAQNGRTGCTTC